MPFKAEKLEVLGDEGDDRVETRAAGRDPPLNSPLIGRRRSTSSVAAAPHRTVVCAAVGGRSYTRWRLPQTA